MQQADAKLIARVGAHFAESARLKTEAAPMLGAPIAQAGLMLPHALKAGGKAPACRNRGPAGPTPPFFPQLPNPFPTQRPPPAPPPPTTPHPHPTPAAP